MSDAIMSETGAGAPAPEAEAEAEANAKTEADVTAASAMAPHLMAPGPARPFLALLKPLVEGLGFQLLRIRMTGDDGKMVLQVMAENDDFGLTIEQCETISHTISDVLDVENPIAGAYALEVSSPGVARPLTRPEDFEHWVGYEAKLAVQQPIDGQKRFRGAVEGFVDGEARLQVQLEGYDGPQILGFALDNVSEARLVPDETELKASLRAAKGK
ncbi:MAG: ribosome maturation factor RimP [Alphaproteobacteria bacterium]|nr:ribosome maturation factor RimP [Alphaproteobacteria bacterium]